MIRRNIRQLESDILKVHRCLIRVDNGLMDLPRGKGVADEKDPHLIAGATGVAVCIGSDFVKVNYPRKEGHELKEIFKEVVLAAGRTKVVCAGRGIKRRRGIIPPAPS